MITTPSQTVDALRRIGVPELLIRVAQGALAPGELRHEIQTPRNWYGAAASSLDRLPFGGRLVPLWETNGDSLTAYVEEPQPQVIRYYYEDAGTQYEVVGHSVWGAIEHLLGWLLHETGADPGSIREAAAACGHPDPVGIVQRLQAQSDA